MKTDIEIAQMVNLEPITKVAQKVGISADDLIPYGNDKAKLEVKLNKLTKADAKLILVTAINPTPAGEGKSTTTVGLVDSLNALGKKTIGCLREPSLGPVFGVKGGACGGGYAQVVPMEEINLHFTGDMHAITAANNLISACLDNHLFQGNELEIDPKSIEWIRVMDMNDRNLRNITIGQNKDGVERLERFQITVASEMMAILCLAKDINDFKARVAQIIVGYNTKGKPVFVADLKITGAITALMKDALKPNLVQTLEHNPVLVHGGPFANIAHGCNSLIATKLGLKLADYVVTEAGFGADLGAEKFMDIKARIGNLKVDLIVIVATIRALKYNGGQQLKTIETEDLTALKAGVCNLEKHLETVSEFAVPKVVCINKFATDTEAEINLLVEHLQTMGISVEVNEVFSKGSNGGQALAKQVIGQLENNIAKANQQYIYELTDSVQTKLEKIATKVYGANAVALESKAQEKLERLEQNFNLDIPICIAKTPNSLSGDPKVLGRPTDFTIEISDLKLANGAGFLICYVSSVMTMPGLSKTPNATRIDVDSTGKISNLS